MQQTRIRLNRRRATAVFLTAFVGLSAGLGGCVNQRAYDDLVQENRTLISRNSDLASRIADLEGMNTSLRGNTSGAQSAISSLEEERNRLRQELAMARTDILSLEEQMAGLELGGLDSVTDEALRRLASRFPDLVQYDPDRGMLRFSSDLTFDSGSAVVKDTAKASLSALAGVLKSGEAGQYDIRIVGHTDAQRISARTAQRHPSNMHLSAHRAIAVRKELISLGVSASKMEASGWGEHRPVAANGTNGASRANRRVEIFLVAGTSGGNGSAPTSSGPAGVIDREGLGASRYEPTK